mgnify:FL=1
MVKNEFWEIPTREFQFEEFRAGISVIFIKKVKRRDFHQNKKLNRKIRRRRRGGGWTL